MAGKRGDNFLLLTAGIKEKPLDRLGEGIHIRDRPIDDDPPRQGSHEEAVHRVCPLIAEDFDEFQGAGTDIKTDELFFSGKDSFEIELGDAGQAFAESAFLDRRRGLRGRRWILLPGK